MRAADVARVVKRVARAADLDPASFSGHSLRAGFITAAATYGAPLARIQDVSRHASLDVLVTYIRRANQFADHAGEAFL
jgi:integrase